VDRFQELIEKWQNKADKAEYEYNFGRRPGFNRGLNSAMLDCIDDLRRTLLLIEADLVLSKK
jgi:hypothetical protein